MDRLDRMRWQRKKAADQIRYFRKVLADEHLQYLYVAAVRRPPKPTKEYFKEELKRWRRIARDAGNAKGLVEIPRRELKRNATALRRLSIEE